MERFAIRSERLNERLAFTGRSRRELAEAVEARGQRCDEQAIKQCLCKDDRPYLVNINRMIDGITATWVRERKEALAAEIKDKFPTLADEKIEVIHVDSPAVAVTADGRLLGVYDPVTKRIYG